MRKYERVRDLIAFCDSTNISAKQANSYLQSVGSSPLGDSKKISDVALRPEVNLSDLLKVVPRGTPDISDNKVVESVEITLKYRGYIEREKRMAEKLQRLEDLVIPKDFDFDKVSGLTIECRQKLKRYAPKTIAQASRISGVSPSDISVLLVYFGR